MRFKIKGARLAALLLPVLALAAPAFGQDRDPRLSDSQEPGSVIVFPKFVQGTVALPEGGSASVTELEIGVVCPKGVICPEHEPVKIRFHWVCGTGEFNLAGSFVCRETDFDVTATVWEKIVLVPNGSFDAVSTKTVPPAPCFNGYLIGWVIDPKNDQPIKFDGLVGDGVIRQTGAAIASYSAIPIQADPALANAAAVTTNANGALMFDGAAGHYQAVTGQIIGDVRYVNLTTPPNFNDSVLTLLTLDVKSNRPNNPVFVDLDFFGGNPSVIGNENQVSTFTEFICWEEIQIELLNGGADLTTTLMGRKGVFASDQAQKVGIFGIQDGTGPVTLLGLSEVREGNPQTPTRAYFSNLFNSSRPVPTRFLPDPSPNFLP
jgi:hypothetical protein